jgi:hypothetical protein
LAVRNKLELSIFRGKNGRDNLQWNLKREYQVEGFGILEIVTLIINIFII